MIHRLQRTQWQKHIFMSCLQRRYICIILIYFISNLACTKRAFHHSLPSLYETVKELMKESSFCIHFGSKIFTSFTIFPANWSAPLNPESRRVLCECALHFPQVFLYLNVSGRAPDAKQTFLRLIIWVMRCYAAAATQLAALFSTTSQTHSHTPVWHAVHYLPNSAWLIQLSPLHRVVSQSGCDRTEGRFLTETGRLDTYSILDTLRRCKS